MFPPVHGRLYMVDGRLSRKDGKRRQFDEHVVIGLPDDLHGSSLEKSALTVSKRPCIFISQRAFSRSTPASLTRPPLLPVAIAETFTSQSYSFLISSFLSSNSPAKARPALPNPSIAIFNSLITSSFRRLVSGLPGPVSAAFPAPVIFPRRNP